MKKTFAAAVAVFALCLNTRAAFRLPFDLEQATWDSTDIVLVTQDDSLNGHCTVVESWKGGLQRGESLTLPSLRDFAPPAKRSIPQFPEEKLPVSIDGLRLALFLKHSATNPRQWGNTNGDAFERSLVWFQDGKAFASVQANNPGPLVLRPLQLPMTDQVVSNALSELQTKLFVLDEVQQQGALAKAAQIENREQRRQAFNLLTASKIKHVSDAAQAAVAALDAAPPPPATNVLDPDAVPEISFHGTPLGAAIRNLATRAGLKVELNAKLNVKPDGGDGIAISQRPVTITWENKSPRQALNDLLETNGLILLPGLPGKPMNIIQKTSKTGPAQNTLN